MSREKSRRPFSNCPRRKTPAPVDCNCRFPIASRSARRTAIDSPPALVLDRCGSAHRRCLPCLHKTRATSCSSRPLFHPSARRSQFRDHGPLRWARGDLARRHPPRIHRPRRQRQSPALPPPSNFGDPAGFARNRRGHVSLLVRRQPRHRILRARQSQTREREWRISANVVRRR